MSEEIVKIPKFRKTSRICNWMANNEYEGRLPAEIENIFFTTKESSKEVLAHLTEYHNQIDQPLPENLENLLYEKAKEVIPATAENDYVVHQFLRYCWNRHHSQYEDNHQSIADDQKYIDLYKGKSNQLVHWALWTKTRLPDYLEDSIDDPSALLSYATQVLRGRLPSHLEDVFIKDVNVATQYAFDVIRGFAPVKLPDSLHSFVILESYKDPNNAQIKVYIKASESDPNKTGNSVFDDHASL